MNKTRVINVLYNNQNVGTMALYNKALCAFEYSDTWLDNGFSISPLSIPLEKKVFIPNYDPFNGLFGVFSDSLPDGWGQLLLDRLLVKKKINPRELNPLERLSIIGSSGMGGLTYVPEINIERNTTDYNLDQIAEECSRILKNEDSGDLDSLFILGGSSGGARPKMLTTVNGEDWIIKFPSSLDTDNIGKEEFDYSNCAMECGIVVEETKLFPSNKCSGYFGTKRFDRNTHFKPHMISVSGLLEVTHRIPNLDYNILMKLTLQLTKDMLQCEQLFRLMCFNVFANNRDDHSKNFSFLYNHITKAWTLSPAYDLTHSFSLGGEHATTINGNGRDPGIKDILEVANIIGLNKTKAKQIALEIKDSVYTNLKNYL
ncbi:type II toxin-antitoxin system HipA family toxin [Thiospirochaeta perfilievii]|uniref:Type II toxin-antitoxin system HipA family toxin n=1 Tax=Thiospirochaeta perfilievii TaxID=252967 RepID=A0A5C1Q7V6_9SPIO|nr:type II toxin-antitoxin system HipA family toxin [Thiospirochaeta perfilievii]QEN03398.1 type II toxin-antitoxin system HipA family toxin [Thiospirochaeta perfilievii]